MRFYWQLGTDGDELVDLGFEEVKIWDFQRRKNKKFETADIITVEIITVEMKICLALAVEEKIARHSKSVTVSLSLKAYHVRPVNREIVVQFNADVADGMQWKFTPTQREVRVKRHVTPMKAGVYFNKIQCFCFEEQRLLSGEQIDMPVFFYIDPEFGTNPRMDGINNLILSYTFFKVTEENTTDTVNNNSSVPAQETS